MPAYTSLETVCMEEGVGLTPLFAVSVHALTHTALLRRGGLEHVMGDATSLGHMGDIPLRP
jgi:hypothetical protein